jgi:catechol 2,3-dioxygenase-like lactoylglutathione lyase family enzyme
MSEMTAMNRINIICLGVRDIVKSRAFYKDVLGFSTPNGEESPQVVFFDNQGTKLELYPLDRLAEDIDEKNPPRTGGGFGGMTLAYNAKSRAEVDEIFRKLEARGVKIAKQPQEVFWGGYSGYFQDPDGYYWEVGYADIWKFDKNDMLVIE